MTLPVIPAQKSASPFRSNLASLERKLFECVEENVYGGVALDVKLR
jgi:hypothetical protein